MTATTSRIPAATDALTAALTAAIGDTTNVVDGPPLDWDELSLAQDSVNEKAFLFVGAVPDSDLSATGTQDFNAAGAVSRDEQFMIYCTAFVWDGDQDVKTRRDDAFALIAQCEQAIRNDPTLAGAILYSRLAGVTGSFQRQTEDGSECTVTFAVACRAYLD